MAAKEQIMFTFYVVSVIGIDI